MIAAIHQPNYLPWLGLFDKMRRADVFVHLDSVPFTRGSYQNRTRIRTADGPVWLTVPVRTAGRSGQLTNEVQIDERATWKRKHLARIEDAYRGCPGLPAAREALTDVFGSPWTRIADLNIALLDRLRELLSLRGPTVRASTLPVQGASSHLLISICRAVGANEYLAGQGSRSYMDEAAFEAAGIRVRYQEFEHPVYSQPHGDFVAGLSVIDLLCAEGTRARQVLAG